MSSSTTVFTGREEIILSQISPINYSSKYSSRVRHAPITALDRQSSIGEFTEEVAQTVRVRNVTSRTFVSIIADRHEAVVAPGAHCTRIPGVAQARAWIGTHRTVRIAGDGVNLRSYVYMIWVAATAVYGVYGKRRGLPVAAVHTPWPLQSHGM